jgi:hypothetical protein
MNGKNFITGDWVKAKSMEGELLIGYIEGVNEERKTARIKVVQAEQGFISGRAIETLLSTVTLLPSADNFTKETVMELIDLALLTRDEKWFNELTDELKRFEETTNKGSVTRPTTSVNRLHFPHVK